RINISSGIKGGLVQRTGPADCLHVILSTAKNAGSSSVSCSSNSQRCFASLNMTAKSDGLVTVRARWLEVILGWLPFFAGLIKPPCPSLYCVVMIQSCFSLRYGLWITVFVTVSHATLLDESLFAQQT